MKIEDIHEEISPENYANWFALYHLCQNIGAQKAIHISSIEFGKVLNLSQQTASRRINGLEDLGWIKRKIDGKDQVIKVTKKGADIMFLMYKNMKKILENILIVGEVTEGMGEGGYYVAISGYYSQFQDKLGFDPYKGTLNLVMSDINNELFRENLKNRNPVVIEGFKEERTGRTYGSVICYKCIISNFSGAEQENKLNAAILDIERTHHDKNTIEILARDYLRDTLKIKDGDRIRIEFSRSD